MDLAEDELIIEEILFIHKNFEIYTVSDFAKKLNHKKEVIRSVIKRYGFRKYEDGIPKIHFIHKVISDFGYINEVFEILADHLNSSKAQVRRDFNKRKRFLNGAYKEPTTTPRAILKKTFNEILDNRSVKSIMKENHSDDEYRFILNLKQKGYSYSDKTLNRIEACTILNINELKTIFERKWGECQKEKAVSANTA